MTMSLTDSRIPGRLALSALLGLSLLLSCIPATAGDQHNHKASMANRQDAQQEAPSDELRILRELTKHIFTLNSQAALGDAHGRARTMADLQRLAELRSEILSEIIESHPENVLGVAIPADFRNGLAGNILSLVEETIEAEGLLEIYYEERESGSHLLYQLNAGKAKYALHFAGEPPTEYETGDRVRIRGVRVGEAVALEPEEISPAFDGKRAALTLANTFGEQKTLVMLVNFQDNASQPYSLDHARNVVFTTTNDFIRENSYGQTWLKGDVVGWYTLPTNGSECNYSAIASYARQAAAAAGINTSAYSRHIFAFPGSSCGWWGLGTVGGNPSSTWVNGTFSLGVVAHELGHNLGLYHSRARDCGSNVMGENCSISEYGDTVDMMGASHHAHFNAYQKERLGWLGYGSSPPLTTAQSGGDYILDPFQTPGTVPKAIKILQSTDPATGKKIWYYLEQRQALGFDSPFSGNSNLLNGVVFHLGSEVSARNIDLLDITRETSSFGDPALVVGRSYTDNVAGVTVTTLAAGSAGATVNISMAPRPCVRANPVITLAPSKGPWVMPGTTVVFDVTVVNKDGDGCAPATFALQAPVQAGWSSVFDSSQLSIQPGTSSATKLRMKSASSTPDGFYDFTAQAANTSQASLSGSTIGTYVIVSSLSVVLETDKLNYSTNQWMNATATVTSGDSPVAGATVVFTLTMSNGSKVTQTSVSGSSGVASFRYRINKKDPIGRYTLKAQVTKDVLAGNAESFFEVK